MKNEVHYQHPMLENAQKIKENGFAVFDGVRELPSGEEPFTSPDYVICIGHRGNMQMTYDDMPDHSSKQTVAVVFPNHTLRMVSKSDDYLATLVVVDASLLDDPLLRIIGQMRYRYEPHPWVELNHREYGVIMHLVGVMRETVDIDIPDKRLLLTRQLGFFMRLLSYYRTVKLNESPNLKYVSIQFQNNLTQHYRDHRDVGFYAEKACLTPKHFSTVIRQETGHTAAWWIHSHVVAEAKALLQLRRDLNIQTVADMLGFADQATFSRYFHRETGFYPSEFREGN
ncbi:MAG: helix-turn-helix domain-containing protein [Bacteroidales bacterium]|nr:helix-turn-helix domain-containing protein [Bacteroidales bacterium]